MKNYHNLLQEILDTGIRQSNRTGIDTLTLPGAMLKFDLREGFPAVTTKKLAFGQVKGELIGFLRGVTSAADFRALGCNVWDQNANENEAWLANPARKGEDDLGRIYGAQWRSWPRTVCETVENPDPNAVFPKYTVCRPEPIDQIAVALHDLRHNPTSRRIIVTAWNPAELHLMALPPCHKDFQLLVHGGTLHMTMYQRSCDMFLGIPFNIASYALLLELFAAWSGYTAGTLTMFLADAHIYVNHIDQVKEQLTREPFPLPQLVLPSQQFNTQAALDELLAHLQPGGILLENYLHHPAIKAPMAV